MSPEIERTLDELARYRWLLAATGDAAMRRSLAGLIDEAEAKLHVLMSQLNDEIVRSAGGWEGC